MKVQPINALSASLLEQSKEIVTVDAWRDATQQARSTAYQRELFLKPILEITNQGISKSTAFKHVQTLINCEQAPSSYIALAKSLASGSKTMPGRSTVYNWLEAYENSGLTGLLDNHTGRVRKDYGWESLALQLFHIPSKPSMAAVARKLREEYGMGTASDSRVKRYLRSMPANLGENSPQRMGKHKYNNSQKHYIHRTTENVPVGAIWQGDGHTVDIYLQHPVTGKPWRAELVVWMDIRSRYIVGWAVTNAESAIGTIQAMGRSLIAHDHVPAIVYVDNGSGYKSKMMCDENVGFYQRMGMDVIFAIPGNAKAKGNLERWFRIMERDLNVWFPDAFVGEGMDKEVAARQFNLVQQGKITLPTLEDWCAAFSDWLDKYHQRPHPENKNTTPLALWSQLENTPVNMTEVDLFKPQILRKVRRGYINLHNRKYQNPDLIAYNGMTVSCEYSLHNDEVITVRDDQGRLICDALLVKKQDYIPTSRIEEARDKSLQASIKRLQKKADEKIARAKTVIEHTESLDLLESFDADLIEQDNNDLNIDLLDDDYLD